MVVDLTIKIIISARPIYSYIICATNNRVLDFIQVDLNPNTFDMDMDMDTHDTNDTRS